MPREEAIHESELLARIAERSTELGARFGYVRVGPGDDCAVVDVGGGPSLLTVDQLVEHRHFRAGTPADLIARKAVARSISDIAAMAGEPICALATGLLPPGFPRDRADALFDAMKRWSEHWGCPLVGGDLAAAARASDPLMLTVTVIGRAHAARGAVLRAGAKPGDGLYVTGPLGGSFDAATGMGRHLTFEPRVREARALADGLGADLHAMIDLSDGLGRDAARLAAASGARAELDAARLPIAAEASEGWRSALRDGEDYELLLAAPAGVAAVAGVPLTRVGTVVAGSGCVVRTPEGEMLDASGMGWDH